MKTYVLDTNVLMNDPNAIFNFENNHVVLPLTVIEEIDNHKKDQNEVGRNARQTARNLDELRKKGSLHDGVMLENGGKLTVQLALGRTLEQLLEDRLPIDLDASVADNRILAVAIQTKGILVTKDTNLRIKADALGVPAEDYMFTKVNVDNLYTGAGKLYVEDGIIGKIYTTGVLTLENIPDLESYQSVLPNECFVVHDMYNEKSSALVRYDAIMKEFKLLPHGEKAQEITPRNSEQTFALNLCLDENIEIVSMIGKAGSGKTLLALAAGLEGVDSGRYSKLLLLKPVAPMDNNHELGFLPGDMSEKLAPWMASYTDNIEFIMGWKKDEQIQEIKKKTKNGKDVKEKDDWKGNPKLAARVSPTEELVALNVLELGSLEHIRGRSLPNQYIILDECQNMTINSIKTVITRAGEGTKIVLLGDISQIDVPYLDAASNGLTYVADRFKEQGIAGHITLMKSERSKLAELAAELL